MPDREREISSQTKKLQGHFFVVWEDNDMACVAVRGAAKVGFELRKHVCMLLLPVGTANLRGWRKISTLWIKKKRKKKEHSRKHTAHLIRECI